MEKSEAKRVEPPMPLVAFVDLPPLERWKLSEKWLKAKQSLPAIISAWQTEAAAMPVDEQSLERVRLAYILAVTQGDLTANVLPRLAFDRLLISLDT
jgi:hypothetical protein